MTLVGRLAPSPTGAQHVGNARTYLLAWLAVRSAGGTIILRIEDIDSPRTKAGAAQQAMEDLRWLGLDWDEGPGAIGPRSPYFQTQRLELYQHALQQLIDRQQVYPCTCSRSDVAAAASAPHLGQEGPIYRGPCAERRAEDASGLEHSTYCWRFRSPDIDIQIDDAVAGTVNRNPMRELGDFVVARSTNQPSYQLAVVVDDHAMGVTHVLRGDDLLPSAIRQACLYRFFGWAPPQLAHVPLVVGPDGRRLAKRHGDTRLAQLRAEGIRAERLVGVLAWTCGLIDKPLAIHPRDLIPEFDLSKLPRQPLVWTDRHWEMVRNPAALNSSTATRFPKLFFPRS